ncbi:S8 family serine peptidase [Rhodovulum tesquicola]|uniref:S8 family serine peptidase n=1 Tax=Rhodovulum tesquicola TaxID=540254 RepID=UPI0020973CF7|nr:S8 family serine peptidase [Rhodovulum tesquicola]MCO8146404.1 S8 family serine peptidase [Rhodovulum tesquicola]
MAIPRSLSVAFKAAALVLTASVASAQEVRPWMPSDIGQAWNLGYKGQKTTITVIDDFRSNYGIYGDLRGRTELLRHGEWTALEAGMMAPKATVLTHDFSNTKAVKLRKGLNTLNLSYGMIAKDGYSAINWSARETSIIKYARDGKAVIVKAAGNDGIAVGAANASGMVDYLNRDLVGKKSAIFVGALNAHGSVDRPASLAWYSNTAGSNPTVQNQFLVVGVTGNTTGLYGTSFAAPIVSGYAAVLGSKFTKANPTQITNQLLNTARTDTIRGYSADLHGRGEASISRALAPVSIR